MNYKQEIEKVLARINDQNILRRIYNFISRVLRSGSLK